MNLGEFQVKIILYYILDNTNVVSIVTCPLFQTGVIYFTGGIDECMFSPLVCRARTKCCNVMEVVNYAHTLLGCVFVGMYFNHSGYNLPLCRVTQHMENLHYRQNYQIVLVILGVVLFHLGNYNPQKNSTCNFIQYVHVMPGEYVLHTLWITLNW